MRTVIAVLLVSLPAAAQAYDMSGGGHWHGGGGHAATVLYAALAALGYLIVQHAAKQTAAFVKRTGVVLGMTLVVIGLLGVLCGVGHHIKRGMSCRCCSGQEMLMRGGPEGKTGEMPAMPEGMKAPESAKKKTK